MVLSVERDQSTGLTSQVISATNLSPDGLRPDRNAGLVLILPLQLARVWDGGIRHGKSGFVSQQMHINAYISVRS